MNRGYRGCNPCIERHLAIFVNYFCLERTNQLSLLPDKDLVDLCSPIEPYQVTKSQKNHRSQKYIKETAGKLWKTLSEILGEEVSKSNLKSSLQRYYHSNFSNVINSIQINKGNICTGLSEKELKQSNIYQQAKLETIPELIKEGLTIEQITRALKLPIDLVRSQIEEFE